MSHFYGTLTGQAGEATRCGSKGSGVRTIAASWSGAIQVSLWYNARTGQDEYTVARVPWSGRGDIKIIATGIVGGGAQSRGRNGFIGRQDETSSCHHGIMYQ